MLSADEARRNSTDAKLSSLDFLVRQAGDDGKMSVTINGEIEDDSKAYLEKLGYTVIEGVTVTMISWEDKDVSND